MCLTASCLAACGCVPTSRGHEPQAAGTLAFLPALAGEYFELFSQRVQRPFHIYVRLPTDYQQSPDSRYPVVYVLDGDSLFPILAPTHLFLNYDEGLPEAIIVGIAYGSFDRAINKRGYDFSADAADATAGQGGADAFHAFLKHELIPKIEQSFRANPQRRILFGQSRGGYLVLYSAFTDPDVFWGRIASNPAFDPGRERFLSVPVRGTRGDLSLVVTSSSRDVGYLREAALEWFEHWSDRTDAPWKIHAITMDGATHAADSSNSYRAGMLRLFELRSPAKPVR